MKNTEERLTEALRALYKRYGYTQYRMRKFEEYDLYVQNKAFLLSDHIITFTEPSGRLMALRPDVTLSIAKNNKGEAQRLFYQENVYRVERDSDSFREITQVGLECVGEIDAYCVLEVLSLALASMACIGEDFVLDISHLGLLSALLAGAGIPAARTGEAMALVGEKNTHGLAALCREAGVSPEKAEGLCRAVSAYGSPREVLDLLSALPLGEGGEAALGELRALLGAIGDPRVRVDLSVVGDMRYYSGIVFRGFAAGIPAGVLSGGQYDNLMQRMGKRGGAVGFAVYPDQLKGLLPPEAAEDADILLLYDEGADPAALMAAANGLMAEGNSVAVRRTVPEKMTYGKAMRFGADGVKEI
ncbi:MAG: ATP phosphoribosyltransferase regulatory subunit [Clostridia bacterium]|nr:ATP phosphoribosyltransferase regulatory subunit [Clostridia bacterium]